MLYVLVPCFCIKLYAAQSRITSRDANRLGTEQNEPTGPRSGTRKKIQNKPTGRRRGTKGKPPPIVVLDPVTKLSSARVGKCARRQERSMRAKAGSISPPPPTLSQRTSPTCITDPAPIDDSSAGNVDLPRKRRSSDAVAVSNNQALVETSLASNLIESPTSVQPHISDEAAVEVPAIRPGRPLMLKGLERMEGEAREQPYVWRLA